MKKSLAVVAIVLGSVMGNFLWAGQLTTEEKRALELKPAVVLVAVQFKTKWSLPGTPFELEHAETETGTGFLFRPDGYLITNGHVVTDANLKDPQAIDRLKQQLMVEFFTALQQGEVAEYIEGQIHRKLTDAEREQVARSGSQWKISIEGTPTLQVILQNGKVLNADILQFSAPVDQGGKDVAVLKIPGDNLPTVKLGNSDNVRLQDQIMVMGYPGIAAPWSHKSASSIISMESSFEPSATNGHISALKTESIGTPLLQSDVAIYHGNSGGPAFNDQGEVIGLATYGAQEAQGFNFLVPINTAMEFVRQSGVTPEIGAFNKHWIQALDLYDAGLCNHSIGEFDNVAQFMPGLRDAQKYRAAAVACVQQDGPIPEVGRIHRQRAAPRHRRRHRSGCPARTVVGIEGVRRSQGSCCCPAAPAGPIAAHPAIVARSGATFGPRIFRSHSIHCRLAFGAHLPDLQRRFVDWSRSQVRGRAARRFHLRRARMGCSRGWKHRGHR